MTSCLICACLMMCCEDLFIQEVMDNDNTLLASNHVSLYSDIYYTLVLMFISIRSLKICFYCVLVQTEALKRYHLHHSRFLSVPA